MSTPVVGVVGAGQLARMMQEAAVPLGVPLRLLAETSDASAAQVIPDCTVGDYTDMETLTSWATGCTVVTFDHEHVPPGHLQALQGRGIACRPGPDALVHAQDKAVLRSRLANLGIDQPRFAVVEGVTDVARLAPTLGGWPLVIKTARGGYDGKGVWVVKDAEAAQDCIAAAPRDVQLIAEEHVDFARELSALVVRSPSGQAATYPVVESVQRDGICAEVTAPAPELPAGRAVDAQRLAMRIASELGVTGVLAVELFETKDGRILVNELAMRPHNTGHWSIEGAVTSQFENHLRAVLDLPLGSPVVRTPWTVMVNILGGVDQLFDGYPHVLARDPAARVHLYGKAVRPGRKVGHVTAYGDDLDDVRERARHAAGWFAGTVR